MTDEALLERITLNPKVMMGKPVVKGTRLTVEFVINLLAHGATVSEIVEEYQGLSPDDIHACLLCWRIAEQHRIYAPCRGDRVDAVYSR